eukprot:Gb_32445 [translate_table: standard]
MATFAVSSVRIGAVAVPFNQPKQGFGSLVVGFTEGIVSAFRVCRVYSWSDCKQGCRPTFFFLETLLDQRSGVGLDVSGIADLVVTDCYSSYIGRELNFYGVAVRSVLDALERLFDVGGTMVTAPVFMKLNSCPVSGLEAWLVAWRICMWPLTKVHSPSDPGNFKKAPVMSPLSLTISTIRVPHLVLRVRFSGIKGLTCAPKSKAFPLLQSAAGTSRTFHVFCAAKPHTVSKVCDIVKKQLALPSDSSLTPDSKFATLGADSLDTVEIVMALEEEFKISVEEENSENITTVQEAADLIESLLEKKAGSSAQPAKL